MNDIDSINVNMIWKISTHKRDKSKDFSVVKKFTIDFFPFKYQKEVVKYDNTSLCWGIDEFSDTFSKGYEIIDNEVYRKAHVEIIYINKEPHYIYFKSDEKMYKWIENFIKTHDLNLLDKSEIKVDEETKQ